MPLNLKPAKPSLYDGKRDSLTVETWLYQVEQYLALVQVGSPETPINDGTKMSYASSLFTRTAATWWYMLVQAGSVCRKAKFNCPLPGSLYGRPLIEAPNRAVWLIPGMALRRYLII
jgi:hypothetical protein